MTVLASLSLLLLTPSGQGGPGIGAIGIQIALFIGIFYVLILRPQRRQQDEHKKLLASLQRGDRIVTSSGIVGEVVHIKDDEITVRSGESKFVMLRSGVANITGRTTVEAKQG
jgi:preprotein translocase subunit YajC